MEEKETVAMPVCPHCKTEMEPMKFEGYYDDFFYWGCKCEELPNATSSYGQYC